VAANTTIAAKTARTISFSICSIWLRTVHFLVRSSVIRAFGPPFEHSENGAQQGLLWRFAGLLISDRGSSPTIDAPKKRADERDAEAS
jgi:hypothetical protein